MLWYLQIYVVLHRKHKGNANTICSYDQVIKTEMSNHMILLLLVANSRRFRPTVTDQAGNLHFHTWVEPKWQGYKIVIWHNLERQETKILKSCLAMRPGPWTKTNSISAMIVYSVGPIWWGKPEYCINIPSSRKGPILCFFKIPLFFPDKYIYRHFLKKQVLLWIRKGCCVAL